MNMAIFSAVPLANILATRRGLRVESRASYWHNVRSGFLIECAIGACERYNQFETPLHSGCTPISEYVRNSIGYENGPKIVFHECK